MKTPFPLLLFDVCGKDLIDLNTLETYQLVEVDKKDLSQGWKLIQKVNRKVLTLFCIPTKIVLNRVLEEIFEEGDILYIDISDLGGL
jgi:hypothetical protein